MDNNIDIIIPCLPEDINLLKLCLEGIKQNILNNVKNIYVISPLNNEIYKFCQNNNLIFIDELSLFGFNGNNIKCLRPGWLFQQLIKFHGEIGVCENYLCLDADHILLKPHQFIKDNKYNFYCTSEYYIPYFNTINSIFDNKYSKVYNCSFISDKMIFNKSYIKELKNEIEYLNNDTWYNVLIKYFQSFEYSISEFEIYGTWISNKYPEIFNILDANKININTKIDKCSFIELQNKYNNYMSITQYRYSV